MTLSISFPEPALTPEEMLQAIEISKLQNVSGGLLFDSLLLACARKVHATAIYTINTRHLRRLAPDLASIIHEP